jgi:predicted transcriptional regulator
MGASKTELFTPHQIEVANMARALAHPARIAILQLLVRKQACVCGSIVEEVGLAQSTISQHLKELKEAGIVQGTIDGTNVCYCINPQVWKQYRSLFSSFFFEMTEKDKCC